MAVFVITSGTASVTRAEPRLWPVKKNRVEVAAIWSTDTRTAGLIEA